MDCTERFWNIVFAFYQRVLFRDVGEGRAERYAVVVPVDEHAFGKLLPVAHVGLFDAELLQQVHREKVLDDEFSSLDYNFCVAVSLEAQILLVTQEVDDFKVHPESHLVRFLFKLRF